MPIIKSAKKRVKTANKARVRNAQFKRSMRDALKAFNKAIAGGKAAEIQKTQREAVSALDTAVKKEIIHRNKAARQKAALAVRAKAAGAKPSASPKSKVQNQKSSPKKAPAKKTAKAAPKKPTTAPKKSAKTPVKKPASKK